jgi:hypothetical protein
MLVANPASEWNRQQSDSIPRTSARRAHAVVRAGCKHHHLAEKVAAAALLLPATVHLLVSHVRNCLDRAKII